MKEVVSMGIREMRLEKNLTQEQLADIMGVTQGAVVQWEAGNTFPRMKSVPKLAEVLGVPVDKLIEALNENSAVPDMR